jgi:hypothetical protein
LLLSLGLLVPAAASAADAGGRPVYSARRLATPIVVDGRLDDAAWGEPTFELAYETRPGDNIPPQVRTLGWVAFDDESFYFAFRCFDPDPASIRARYADRDRATEDDFVGVVLDTFDDERRAFEFFLNPLGVQMDFIQNDVTRNEDSSWDAIWLSAGRLTAEGYEVEAAIPLSSLRFPKAGAASGRWGIDAVRIRPRTSTERIGLVPQERGRNCYLCQEAKLDGLSGIEPGRDIELDPTAISYQTNARRPFPTGPFETVDESTEAGLTARWGITPDLTLQGAVNPDFSQIEADVAQLDVNSQFALFYPEKRPFFLEGADYFETEIGAVYTRNVADPAWGAKLTGKQSGNAVGLVLASDETTNLLLPSSLGSRVTTIHDENFSMIGRYRRDVGQNSTLGGLYTGREGEDYWSRLAGLDGQFRLSGSQTITVEALYSRTQYPEAFAAEWSQPAGTLSGHGLTAEYDYSVATWRGFAAYRDYADDFRADLGFVPRVGYRHLEIGAQRIWEGDGKHWYTHMEAGGNVEEIEDTDGTVLEREVELFWFADGPLQSNLHVVTGGGKETFQGLEVHDRFIFAAAEFQPTSWLFLHGEASYKHDQIDYANVRPGDRGTFGPGLRLDIGRHMKLTVDDRYERLDVDGGRLYAANLVEVRATYQFNPRMFVRVVGQYFAIDRDPSLYTFDVPAAEENQFNQLLFSYKLNPQTVLFAGYSDTALGADSLDLTRASKTLFLKVGYAFRL